MKRAIGIILLLGVILGDLDAQHSIARLWNEVLLTAIRNDRARPVVHARNLHHVSSAMYDVWTVFDTISEPYFLGKSLNGYTCSFSGFNSNTSTEEALDEAISHAAYTILNDRFRTSTGNAVIIPRIREVMDSLGYNWLNTSINYFSGSPAALGNYIGRCYITMGRGDNSNEQLDYRNMVYEPINPPLIMDMPGNPDIIDHNRWQPLSLSVFIDQSGNVIPGGVQSFLGAEWGSVYPFALDDSVKTTFNRDGYDYQVYHDPGPPPLMDSMSLQDIENYIWGFELVAIWSSHLDTIDGVMWDISPASIGNNPDLPPSANEYDQFYNLYEGGDASRGHTLNPFTGQPYAPNMVSRADYCRVLAEFWADGPASETPPGHWFTILNYVNDHPQLEKKYRGDGQLLSDLEWDIKTYFLLAGVMHDAAITAWGIKGRYDYLRPVSAIRAMAEKGQRTDPNLPNYDSLGFNLHPGFVELIQPGDSLAGPNDEYVDEIKIYAWRGPDYIDDPDTTMAGVGWIRAKEWWPYQRPTFVTPNFAGYISGHSTFSRAAAEVLTKITGSAFFPGGMGEFHAGKNEFLVFEEGPSRDIVLQWATYRDASDQTSLSRIWGGIHPPADDIPGRKIGIKLADAAFSKSHDLFYPDRDEDGYDALEDCDDNDKNVYPGAPEICDGKDNNCDGSVDEGLALFRYFIDVDNDGYGDAGFFIDTCLSSAPVGYSEFDTDCNDRDDTVNPGMAEICDRKDNNCDGQVNENLTRFRYYVDVDRDGFGRAFPFVDTCLANPQPGFSRDSTDCNDNDPDIYPGATEYCDGVDSDCDGQINNNVPIFSYFLDEDKDGFGNPIAQIDTCINTPPPGYVINNLDCDDTNNLIHPGAVEICDGVDNNCDGQNNEGLTFTMYFFDSDEDGYGNPLMAIDTCLDSPPSGYVDNPDDCDDSNDQIHPAALEVCDGVDNNCDGQNNEGLTFTMYFFDSDKDGYGNPMMAIDTCLDSPPLGYVDNPDDCDDSNDQIHPAAMEVCDGIDNNCDGQNNEGLTYTRYYRDADSDGFGDLAMPLDTCLDRRPVGYVLNADDCNDLDGTIFPGAIEICDGIDNNCNGQNNEGLTRYTYYPDLDGDGFGVTSLAIDTCLDSPPFRYVDKDGDCDDANASIHPMAPEICDNIDNNCNGVLNDGLTIYTYYLDMDGDGYGDDDQFIDTCDTNIPGNFVSRSGDCNDQDASINPDIQELCDGIDNNCDGQIDEGFADVTYYLDADQDGFGDAMSTLDTCLLNPPLGYVENPDDCDDSNDQIFPQAFEIAGNGIDEDCDGSDLVRDPKVFPNPFMDEVTIHDQIQGMVTIFVQSLDGKIFFEKDLEFVNQSLTISLKDIPRGVYFIRGYHHLEEEVFVYKIIKDLGKQ